MEDVRSILEGSGELRGISSQCDGLIQFGSSSSLEGSVFLGGQSDGGVVLENSVGSIGGEINESESINIGGGDVVSDSEGTVAVIILDAVFGIGGRESPVVGGSESIDSISEMVISVPWSREAIRGSDSPGFGFFPGVSNRGTGGLIVGGRIGSSSGGFDA